MKLGILETGKLTPDLELKHGTYPDMFVRLLDKRSLELEFSSYAVVDGQFPATAYDCEAWLITGSRHGAYEEFAWIPKLEAFIRSAHELKVPMLGICFGHQIIAQALGGKVVKSEKGWGLAVSEYQIKNTMPWMSATSSNFFAHAVHQDQVVEVPVSAHILAGSEFCPNAMLSYGNTIFTVQAHPEFTHEFQADLVATRRGIVFDDLTADKAIASLSQAVETEKLATWMIGFLRQHSKQ